MTVELSGLRFKANWHEKRKNGMVHEIVLSFIFIPFVRCFVHICWEPVSDFVHRRGHIFFDSDILAFCWSARSLDKTFFPLANRC